VRLGRPVGLEIDAIFEKLVRGRRGGWCYEMNGLFAWALEEIGFRVTRLAAGVGRAQTGDAAVGNHLALHVDLDAPWLADVGFGDGIFDPVPIRPGPFEQRGLAFALEELGAGWWRIHNHGLGGAASFDFTLEPADRSLLERRCDFLQTSPESSFRKVVVAQRHVPDGLVTLRGRVLRRIRSDDVHERVVEDRADYERVLREVFDLDAPDVHLLWAHALEEHRAFLEAGSASGGLTSPGPRPPSA